MGNDFSCRHQPILEKSSSFHNYGNISIGSSEMQGWRVNMEDTHVITAMPSLNSHIVIGLFDGHGGLGSAIYAEKKIVKFIENTGKWKSYIKDGTNDVSLLKDALTQSFMDLDSSLRNNQRDNSGCTAILIMITPDYIVCANAGDSRCIMGTISDVKALSTDHKPSNTEEKRRINSAGGKVKDNRIEGILSVSRGFGDFQFKRINPKNSKVCCIPEVTIHSRDIKNDTMLIIACDGLWDVLSNIYVYNKVNELIKSKNDNMQVICEKLIDDAFSLGSMDNISVIGVQLPGMIKLSRDLSKQTYYSVDNDECSDHELEDNLD